MAAIVAAGGEPSGLAAKSATATIPIVFGISGDSVKAGLVGSLSRPSGNVTGVTLGKASALRPDGRAGGKCRYSQFESVALDHGCRTAPVATISWGRNREQIPPWPFGRERFTAV